MKLLLPEPKLFGLFGLKPYWPLHEAVGIVLTETVRIVRLAETTLSEVVIIIQTEASTLLTETGVLRPIISRVRSKTVWVLLSEIIAVLTEATRRIVLAETGVEIVVVAREAIERRVVVVIAETVEAAETRNAAVAAGALHSL